MAEYNFQNIILAKKYGFDGWIMLNVYSKRDTKFTDLPNYVNTEWEE